MLTINDKLCSAHVTRWHIIRVARQQTVAEHQYLTWLITVAMGEALQISPLELKAAGTMSLIHDLTEVKTGDMPSVAKPLYNDLAGFNITEAVDDGVDRYITSTLVKVMQDTPISYRVHKMSDTLEAARFLAIEGIGHDSLKWLKGILADFMKHLLVTVADRPLLNWEAFHRVVSDIASVHVLRVDPDLWRQFDIDVKSAILKKPFKPSRSTKP